MKQMIILAGGLATRMKPLTETIAKSMLDIDGKPFIYHQLTLLKQKGIERCVICTGHMGHMIEEYVGDGKKFGIDVCYSFESEKLLGTGGAIKNASTLLEDSFFILYGDSYLDIDYDAIQQKFEEFGHNPYTGLMTVYKNNDLFDKSNVIYENNKVVMYSKREKVKEMNYIDYGLSILKKTVFEDFSYDTSFDLADVFEKLVKKDRLLGYEIANRFYEIGSMDGLAEFKHYVSKTKG